MKLITLISSSLLTLSIFAQAQGPCFEKTNIIANKTAEYVKKINKSKKTISPQYVGYTDKPNTTTYLGNEIIEHTNSYKYETTISGKKYAYDIDITFATPIEHQEAEYCSFEFFKVSRDNERSPLVSNRIRGKKECLPNLKTYIADLESVLFPEIADEERQRTPDIQGSYVRTLGRKNKYQRLFNISVVPQEAGRRVGSEVTNYQIKTRNTGCYLRSIKAIYEGEE
ncbi:hypothetical protein N9N67_09940 [Bacteriovoracaceae bacterium]|nr:hypothetical protein [Bacteriovoracaceae bacterium]